jgi:hypothetical protein
MVSMADVNRDVALVKPVKHLLQVWPDLSRALVDGGPRLTGGETSTWLTLIDRQQQETRFSLDLRTHFGMRADAGRQHRPLFCVVRGHYREGHDHLRRRFAIKPLSERHVLNAQIQSIGIDWDCYGESVEPAMELLRFQLADKLKAESDAPEAIAAAINVAAQPRFIYTTITHERFRASDTAVVGAWIEYLRAVGGEARLSCECYVFLSFAYDAAEHADTDLARFCRDELPALLQGARAVLLPPLDMVEVGHVPTWFDTLLGTMRSEEERRRAERKRVQIVTSVERLFHPQSRMRMADLIECAHDLNFDL